MHQPNYSHPAAPARAIPMGEDLEATRIRVCVQIRAALQELEGGPFIPARIQAVQAQLQGAQRVLFVAKVAQVFPGVPAHVQVGRGGRGVRP